MFDIGILTDKKKQEQAQAIALELLKTINETYKLAKENNELLKKMIERKEA